MKFFISFLFIVFSVVSIAQAQTCAPYFGYNSLTPKEHQSLQELARAQLEASKIQKPQDILERNTKLSEIKRLVQEFVDYGISEAVYKRVLRETNELMIAEGSIGRARNYEQREEFRRQTEINEMLKEYNVDTLTEVLFIAYAGSNIQAIKKILETKYMFEKLDPTYKHEHYGSILHVAAQHGTPEIIKKIVLLGANVSKRNRIGNNTPLDLSSTNKDNFFTLVELGGRSHNINNLLAEALFSKETPYKVIEYLIKNATEINYYQGINWPILHRWIHTIEMRARELGANDISTEDASVLQALLEKGADPTASNYNKESSLDFAKMPTTKAILEDAIVKWKETHKTTGTKIKKMLQRIAPKWNLTNERSKP